MIQGVANFSKAVGRLPDRSSVPETSMEVSTPSSWHLRNMAVTPSLRLHLRAEVDAAIVNDFRRFDVVVVNISLVRGGFGIQVESVVPGSLPVQQMEERVLFPVGTTTIWLISTWAFSEISRMLRPKTSLLHLTAAAHLDANPGAGIGPFMASNRRCAGLPVAVVAGILSSHTAGVTGVTAKSLHCASHCDYIHLSASFIFIPIVSLYWNLARRSSGT